MTETANSVPKKVLSGLTEEDIGNQRAQRQAVIDGTERKRGRERNKAREREIQRAR